MTGEAQPTPEQVRAAAEALKAAIDRHLDAVERRQGENDPAVFAAYDELESAASDYDDMMYDLYDEVTPFEVEDSDDEAEDYLGPEDPDAVSVLIRRDYTVKDREVLIDHARRADPELSDLSEDAQPSTVDSTATALAVVFDVYDPDEIAQRAPELGLEPGDATLWVTAAPATESGEWLESPFDDADPGTVIYRFETSVAYEDELVELERELS